ncbi:MAG: NADH-quinone oxidoreductase subunit NuoE [Candidatus Cloacimonetes bacterium]|nr:NADH-quinone oxidoreductase subunit NuoE [Candidatus Cloacimonadota bacterium]
MTAPNMQLARKFTRVMEIVDGYGRDQAKIIPIMQAIQEEYRYLPEEVLTFVATMLDMSPAKVFGIATFYSHFSLEPKGKYIIRICDGTACHVKGSGKIIEAMQNHLGLEGKQKTTSDMLFTIETVSCLGACGLAPVVVVNDDVYGQVSPQKSIEIIKSYKDKEAVQEN